MEQLLHYCWKHRLFPAQQLSTTDGQPVEVIDTGLHNHNDGPDFFNAKIKIGGTLWVGNIEIHDKASDWYLHRHDTDRHYDNVILHVCENIDRTIVNAKGESVPQMEMRVPEHVRTNYEALINEDRYPPCYRIIPQLSQLTLHSWLSALQTERLEEKTKAIMQKAAAMSNDWEKVLFATLARSYGFGLNGDAFEEWSNTVDLAAAAHHRDDVFQIEAIFMGQAGFLDKENIPQRHYEQTVADSYFQRLNNEYAYLKHKFGLKTMDYSRWRFLRLRPQNFPQIRLSQLAHLYCSRQMSLSRMCECNTTDDVEDMLSTHATPYWQTHFTFGAESKKSKKQLSPASLQVLTINTIVPILFAYGRYKANEKYVDRAFDMLEQLKAEKNNIVAMWQECGLKTDTAADSQALIQLKTKYCDRRDCLRCRIGYQYMKTMM